MSRRRETIVEDAYTKDPKSFITPAYRASAHTLILTHLLLTYTLHHSFSLPGVRSGARPSEDNPVKNTYRASAHTLILTHPYIFVLLENVRLLVVNALGK